MSTPAANPALYPLEATHQQIAALFVRGGLPSDKADAVVRSLLDADMMGHTTHGLALAPWYLKMLAEGQMRAEGEPETVADHGACVAWKGRSLPGAWLLSRAIALALERVEQHGVFTMTIAGSHHIGALATYLPQITERGLMPILTCSGPSAAGVAPYGGTYALFTPNPLAAGIPTAEDPVLLDISASITTLNRARQLAQQGRRFPAAWVMDAQGHPSDDPAVAVAGGGSLLPVGGLDHGHKGYSLALLVEALTQGLSGLGRRDRPTAPLMNVFLQVIDPGFFGGRQAYVAESTWLAQACRANPPRPGAAQVRVPGEQAMVRKRHAHVHGVPLDENIVAALQPLLAQEGLSLPDALPVLA